MRRPILLSLLITFALLLWMASGMIQKKSGDETTAKISKNNITTMRVLASNSKAQQVQQQIISNGQALPDQEALLKVEITGVVETILKKKGDKVKKGDVIMSLSMSDRKARLKEAQAEVDDEKERLKAMAKLHPQGYSARTAYFETKAALAKAKAKLLKIQIEISKTNIIAPFDGEINDIDVELGSFLAPGTSVGTIVNNNPLIIELAIAQKNINKISIGKEAVVNLATGHKLKGKVKFIGSKAMPRTRTFQVDIEVPNPQSFRSGVSAQAIIPTQLSKAHFISPAILSLAPSGELGIKIVNEKSNVAFVRIEIIRTTPKGIWITGPDNEINIITSGQGFVNPGEKVIAVMESSKNAKNN